MNTNKNLMPPCKNCKEKFDICHDSCEKYKQYKTNLANVQAARNEFMQGKSTIVESVRRCKR